MPSRRLPQRDPRTIARDIPGIMSALLPELTPGVVAAINRTAKRPSDCVVVPSDKVDASNLNRAMLFEIAVVVGEQLLSESSVDWPAAIALASARQSRHFDAKPPGEVSEEDKAVAMLVANNLIRMLEAAREESQSSSILKAPFIPGLRWISSSVGDFSVGHDLIEIKCANRHFSSADYRQLVMYWILSYASSLEGRGEEWIGGILINPRLCLTLRLRFDDFLNVTASGMSKVELVESFFALVGSDRESISFAGI
jgi:hypothetical protein